MLTKVVERALDLGCPRWNLALGLQAQLGPRILGAEESVGEWIRLPSRSLAAGCRQSGSWARALLHDALGSVALGYSRAPPGSHVDDICQIAADASGRAAAGWIVGSAAIRIQG